MLTKRYFKTREEVEVTFELDRVDLDQADIAGEWDDWQLTPMKPAKRGKGPFKLRLRLPKGSEYQFRYLLNGRTWDNDEAADAYRPNDMGSENGIVSTFN